MNTTPPAGPTLPEVGDERVDAMERVVFARIAEGRRTRRVRRARLWTGAGAAAAVVVVAAVISPFVLSHLSPGDASITIAEGASHGPVVVPGDGVAVLPGQGFAPGGVAEVAPEGARDAAAALPSEGSQASTAEEERELTSNGSANLVVDDVADAAREIEADVEGRGGHVESVTVNSAQPAAPASGLSSGSRLELYPSPAPEGSGWITARVPAAELRDALDALARVGEVTSSNTGRHDVTDQAIDLRARVTASEASVARLTELIAQAESVGDLIAAESALADRQAALDADRQQLEGLESQVELSTLTVQLTPRTAPAQADPAGFGDGLSAGWNGLIASLNAIVIAIGFLLPWLVVLAAIGAIVWAIATLARRARARARDHAHGVNPGAQTRPGS